MKAFYLLTAAAILAGCATIQEGGAGQTKSGDPVTGLYQFDQATKMFDISVISPRGWTCDANFKQSNQPKAVRSVPLTCSNGATGNLVMSANRTQGQAVGSFQLSNGEAGQIIFGRL